jgi:threonine/homoserine/homoserine lactone efflux protein
MELSTILIKITGVVLLIWTLYSIYRHVREKQKAAKLNTSGEVQSVSEQILNNILLYLWLAFMIVFSIGMIVNN